APARPAWLASGRVAGPGRAGTARPDPSAAASGGLVGRKTSGAGGADGSAGAAGTTSATRLPPRSPRRVQPNNPTDPRATSATVDLPIAPDGIRSPREAHRI